MTIRIRDILTFLLITAAAYGGIRYEAVKIEQSCLDENAATVLNGTAYVCLTMEQAIDLRKRLKERGV
jgi:hypothetical protein